MAEEKNVIKPEIEKYSFKILFMFSFGYLMHELFGMVFQNTQFYYTTVVYLPATLFTIAFVIYTIWNMFNDPLLGHLTDRSSKWTLKYGKRFPWILIGSIGWCISLIMVFFVPFNASSAPLIVFGWLLVSICIYDGFYSLRFTNANALFTDKFRDETQRQKYGGITTLASFIGIGLGIILPPIIIESFEGTPFGWTLQAVIVCIIGLIFTLIMIPSIRETKQMKERRSKLDEEPSEPFFKVLKQALKQKSFLAYTISYLFLQITIFLETASLPFWVTDVLNMPLTGNIVPLLSMLVVTLIVAPLWVKLAKKFGSKVIFASGFIIMCFGILLLLFVSDYLLTTIAFIITGVGLGAKTIPEFSLFSDIIEEGAIKSGKRNEGIYNGIFVFIIRIAIAGQVLIIGLMQVLTGYDPNASIQSPEAIFGIRLQMSIIPIIFLVGGFLIFWFLWDITPQKRAEIQEKLKQMKL